MARGVVLFYTMHDLFTLEKVMKRRGVHVDLIPVPRHLSSDCGSAMSFDAADADSVRAAVDEIGLEVQGIHSPGD